MKQLISFVLATSLLLTGCISKLEEPVAFTQENSVQANPEGRNFHLRIPSDTKLVLTEENEAAKLYRVSDASSGMTYAFVEETPMSVEQAISLLGNLDEVTLLDKQAVELNGYDGQKV